ncbi:hypothetical protein L207DRAFT_552337 [Hyaloscypha variabilis F]|uniref:Uncharacterized protein n=1 Tax=Hyaloscypha variabilis (strain UAMH 11265 / GT02V1 / F) TaxID=1149755 RepID=A0A2J6RZA7_HYAVF|nr:hypothetical protein L207DRAFT_552337 [Hyaloscypha variabilis F]
MALTTRRTSRITPPPGPSSGHKADTIKKTKFFHAYDKEISFKSLRQIVKDEFTIKSTARRWLKQRENMGTLAYRHTRGRLGKLRKPLKITKVMCKKLVDPYTNGGQIYKCAFMKKEILGKNKDEQVAYGQEYKDKTKEDFWSFQALGILRELRKRYDDENIMERGERKGVKFHVATWIT